MQRTKQFQEWKTVMFKRFFQLVEIRTKVASVIPLIWGVVYAAYRFDRFRASPLIFFVIAAVAFDMFTTALNNYMDWKRAGKKHGYNYEEHNAIVRYGMPGRNVVILLAALFAIASVSGLITYFNSDFVVLILGILSFSIGILYSAGPLPLSRTPLGEVFSGIFMGFVLPFIAIYLNIAEIRPILLEAVDGKVAITLDIGILLPAASVLVPTALLIAGIMLANNICDVEDDIAEKRFTLPVCIGRNKALVLFVLIYALCYCEIMVCVILGYLPIASLIVLIPSWMVFRNIRIFLRRQEKRETFSLSVMNFLLIMVPLIISVSVEIMF